MSQTAPAADVVRDLVARADRARRRRASMHALARVAPAAAGGLVAVALVSYLATWTLLTVGVAAIAALAALGLMVWTIRRDRPVTDEVAATIDREADLGGELRSAYWFAVRDVPDEWVAFHLDRAAVTCGERRWHDVYPPVRAPRAWLVTGVLTVAAFALPAGLPSWPAARPDVAAATKAAAAMLPDEFALLPPELQAQIFDLLAQVEAGSLTAAEALSRARRLDGFSNAPPDVQQLIADAIDEAARRQADVARGSSPDDAPPPEGTADVQWARENMASRLANEMARQQQQEASEDQAGGESTKTEDAALGESGEASVGQASAKVPTKDPAAAQGATGLMTQNGTSGDPGSAFGGKKGNVQYGTVEASELAAALKREQVEAMANVDTSDLRHEDKRRRTEQSWSSMRYSRVARRASFDRARVEAPGAVPEARRPLVERYFVRQPEAAAVPSSSTASPSPSPRNENRR